MVTKSKESTAPRMSDAAVKAKTGKEWNEWFATLDKVGAKKMTHQEIVKLLNTKYGVGSWWQQMVTVTYEQARGLRKVHEKPEGYEISASRTIGVPLAKLYKAFADEKMRSRWFKESGLVVRKATPNKSMRATWIDGKTSLEIGFYAKGDEKSQVALQHSKLANEKAAAKMKSYWNKALDRLSEMLSGN
jgi:uncharacterized protein YndB with AHSA1/START domain